MLLFSLTTLKIYIALLKFDFFFFLGFTIQFVVIVVQKKTVEFALTIAAIPVTIVILLMAAVFTRRESKAGVIAVIVSSDLPSARSVSLILKFKVAIFCRPGLFLIQTRTYVSWTKDQGLSSSAKVHDRL